MPILEVIVLGETLTAEAIGQTFYDRTAAEIAASVTPTAYRYYPGDIRRYGAVSNGSTDCAAAWIAAVAQAGWPFALGSAPVYVPAASQGFLVNTGATITGTPLKIYGDNSYYSYLYTTADISILTITNVQQLQGCILENFGIVRSTTVGSTKPGIHFKNSSYNRLIGMMVVKFDKGVRYEDTATAPQSCFSNVIEDSTISECASINIDCETFTNFLSMRNVTFGSAPIGLRYVDSGGLTIIGGDCEGCTTCKIDIDSTVAGNANGVYIENVDFENSNCSQGDIRIGATARVDGVTIVSGYHSNAGSAEWSVNPINCNRLMTNNRGGLGGYNTAFFRQGQPITNLVLINDYATGDALAIGNGTLAFDGANVGYTGRLTYARATLTYGATVDINVQYHNLFKLTVTNGTAFFMAQPTNPRNNQQITIRIHNTSGGACGAITWSSAYKLGGALTGPANTTNRTITFEYDSSVSTWYEVSRSAADAAN